jgi:hypothetical protein
MQFLAVGFLLTEEVAKQKSTKHFISVHPDPPAGGEGLKVFPKWNAGKIVEK